MFRPNMVIFRAVI